MFSKISGKQHFVFFIQQDDHVVYTYFQLTYSSFSNQRTRMLTVQLGKKRFKSTTRERITQKQPPKLNYIVCMLLCIIYETKNQNILHQLRFFFIPSRSLFKLFHLFNCSFIYRTSKCMLVDLYMSVIVNSYYYSFSLECIFVIYNIIIGQIIIYFLYHCMNLLYNSFIV